MTGTCFAETGNQVICVDIDAKKVDQMRNGIVPIYEPHLDVLFERNIRDKRLSFTTNFSGANMKMQKLFFLHCQLLPVKIDHSLISVGVAEELGKKIKSYKVIVDKSTVPVGTAEKVHAAVAKNAKVEFDIVSNPEFLREGFAVDDFLKPDRVYTGVSSERARNIMRKCTSRFVRQGNPIIFMDKNLQSYKICRQFVSCNQNYFYE